MDIALVSGASRGLGAVIARRLAAEGFAVAVTYRSDEDGAGRVVDDIRAAGGTAEAFGTDVTREGDVLQLVDDVRERLGRVRVLVVSATGPQPAVPVEELSWQVHLDQLEYFVKSPTLLLTGFLDDLTSHPTSRVSRSGRTRSSGPPRAAPPTPPPRGPSSA